MLINPIVHHVMVHESLVVRSVILIDLIIQCFLFVPGSTEVQISSGCTNKGRENRAINRGLLKHYLIGVPQ